MYNQQSVTMCGSHTNVESIVLWMVRLTQVITQTYHHFLQNRRINIQTTFIGKMRQNVQHMCFSVLIQAAGAYHKQNDIGVSLKWHFNHNVQNVYRLVYTTRTSSNPRWYFLRKDRDLRA